MARSLESWKEEYRLDLGVVDNQHQQFFTLCAQLGVLADRLAGLDRAGRMARVPELVEAAHGLRSFAMFHFHTEEDLLARSRYEGLFEHMTAHDMYLDKLRTLMKRLEELAGRADRDGAGEPPPDRPPDRPHDDPAALAREAAEWSAHWWERHILRHDLRYAAHVRRAEQTRG